MNVGSRLRCPIGSSRGPAVVLAEDNYLVREGVGKLIDLEPDLELVAACADYPSL